MKTLKAKLLLLIVLTLFGGVGSSLAYAGPPVKKSQKPNVIIVLADDMGYGDAGYTGHPFVKTPNLDTMSKQSVVFKRFYAGAPVCSPTRASIMTGRSPMRTNVLNHGHYMRPDEFTLVAAFKSAGYKTGFFGKWHIGSVQKQSPTSPGKVGFDDWLAGLNFFDHNPYLSKNGDYLQLKGQGTVLTMDATLGFLKENQGGGKPMFVMTWFPSPHVPHKEKPVDFAGSKNLYEEAGKWKGYYSEITLLDQQVGRLRKALREMKLAENTIVWFCSDNGGLVRETSGGRAKKGSIYEGGLRVPAMLEWPAKLKPAEVTAPASTMDIYPTLLKIVGVEIKNQPKLDGVDLMQLIEGEKQTRAPLGFWFHYAKGQSTRSDWIIERLMRAQQADAPNPYPQRLLKNVAIFPTRKKEKHKGHAAWLKWPWKLHRIEKKGKVQLELYQLEKDPMEAENLAQTEKIRANEMLQELKAWQASVLDSLSGKDYQSP